MEYPNFFENWEEANKRLCGTIVCYEGHPHHVYLLSDHKEDGIIRIYMYRVEEATGETFHSRVPNMSELTYNVGVHKSKWGSLIDKWMEKHPEGVIIRKQLNSPAFNKFRPFPLGMVNTGVYSYYVERQPLRRSEQGLVRSAINETRCNLSDTSPGLGGGNVSLYSTGFIECVQGKYPSITEALDWLTDEESANKSVGISRTIALIRGPLNMVFVQYKTDVVGVLPSGSASLLRLGRDFHHLKEAFTESGLFGSIFTQ